MMTLLSIVITSVICVETYESVLNMLGVGLTYLEEKFDYDLSVSAMNEPHRVLRKMDPDKNGKA